jgi:hypothetical protein
MFRPNNVLAFMCAGCPCVPIVAAVFPWHSGHEFVPPPYTAPHVYADVSGEPFCPLLWHAFVPHVPLTVGYVYPLYVNATFPPLTVKVPFRWLGAAGAVPGLPHAVAASWQFAHAIAPPPAFVVVVRCAACEVSVLTSVWHITHAVVVPVGFPYQEKSVAPVFVVTLLLWQSEPAHVPPPAVLQLTASIVAKSVAYACHSVCT